MKFTKWFEKCSFQMDISWFLFFMEFLFWIEFEFHEFTNKFFFIALVNFAVVIFRWFDLQLV